MRKITLSFEVDDAKAASLAGFDLMVTPVTDEQAHLVGETTLHTAYFFELLLAHLETQRAAVEAFLADPKDSASLGQALSKWGELHPVIETHRNNFNLMMDVLEKSHRVTRNSSKEVIQ